jgi:hypothetical protein
MRRYAVPLLLGLYTFGGVLLAVSRYVSALELVAIAFLLLLMALSAAWLVLLAPVQIVTAGAAEAEWDRHCKTTPGLVVTK